MCQVTAQRAEIARNVCGLTSGIGAMIAPVGSRRPGHQRGDSEIEPVLEERRDGVEKALVGDAETAAQSRTSSEALRNNSLPPPVMSQAKPMRGAKLLVSRLKNVCVVKHRRRNRGQRPAQTRRAAPNTPLEYRAGEVVPEPGKKLKKI